MNTRVMLTWPASAKAMAGRLWRSSPPLMVVGVLMLTAAAASVIGILADPRVITGAPAWLKPFKFAVSTAVYSLTLAWIFAWLPDWPYCWSTALW